MLAKRLIVGLEPLTSSLERGLFTIENRGIALCRLSLLTQSASLIPYGETTMKKSLSKLTYKALTGKEAPSFYDSKRAHQNQQLGPRNY